MCILYFASVIYNCIRIKFFNKDIVINALEEYPTVFKKRIEQIIK